MRKNNSKRIRMALAELDYLETVLDVYEDPDFVEIIGGQGGDVSRYRVYFNADDTIDYVCEK